MKPKLVSKRVYIVYGSDKLIDWNMMSKINAIYLPKQATRMLFVGNQMKCSHDKVPDSLPEEISGTSQNIVWSILVTNWDGYRIQRIPAIETVTVR